jgi:uncharacterized membrane protein
MEWVRQAGTRYEHLQSTPTRMMTRANVILGVIFGVLFLRWRRTNPMIIAHALINSVAFIGYTLLAGHVSWLP